MSDHIYDFNIIDNATKMYKDVLGATVSERKVRMCACEPYNYVKFLKLV